MAAFILRRFLYALLLLLIASVLIFYGLRVAPGDVVTAIASPQQAEVIRTNLTEKLGLNEPLYLQYFVFLKHVITGDPGVSVVNGQQITSIIRDSGPQTLRLGFAAIALSYALAIPLGLLAAARRNSPGDQGIRLLSVLGMGIPNFFLAVVLVQVFAVNLRWFPVAGPNGLDHLVLPAVVLAVESMALNVRLMRSSTLEQLSSDYIRTLRAKGITRRRILWVHAMRNALVPVVALAGVIVPTVIGYTLIVEVIFRYEGLGYQLVQAVLHRDYALAQTLALLMTALVILCNFLADIGHQLLDPRVREQARSR